MPQRMHMPDHPAGFETATTAVRSGLQDHDLFRWAEEDLAGLAGAAPAAAEMKPRPDVVAVGEGDRAGLVFHDEARCQRVVVVAKDVEGENGGSVFARARADQEELGAGNGAPEQRRDGEVEALAIARPAA